MGIRVMATVSVPASTKPSVWIDESYGYRALFHHEMGQIDGEDQDRKARTAEFAYAAGRLTGKSVAWIGGGLCYGIRCFAIADCTQTVFEQMAECREFCPEGVEFIPGDYRETMRGTYDVIVFDLGGDVPRKFLAKHLNPGGKILPEKD